MMIQGRSIHRGATPFSPLTARTGGMIEAYMPMRPRSRSTKGSRENCLALTRPLVIRNSLPAGRGHAAAG
jgi:hypothetical protein